MIQGKDIGKTGEVAHVFRERNKVIVESSELINVAKKHQKPTRATMQGGIQDKAMPIHVSNLMLLCSKDGPVEGRLQDRRRRQEDARVPEVRRGAVSPQVAHDAAAPQGALPHRAAPRARSRSSGSAT